MGDWAWPDKETFVFSSKPLKSVEPNITIINDSPLRFIKKIKDKKKYKNIWLLGGAKLVQSFAKMNLINEIILTIIPLNLSSGIKLDLNLRNYQLIKEKQLMDGIRQNIYLKKENYEYNHRKLYTRISG